MNSYLRGKPVNLIARFNALNPVTGAPTPANPTTVTFNITDPDGGVIGPYVFGVNVNVTNPAVGMFVCALPPQVPVGIYHYQVVGTGLVEDVAEDDFEVLESAVDAPAQPDAAIDAPCQPWIDGCDVAVCAQIDYNQMPWVFDTVASEAGAALYQISGRRYSGVCERTVRPCSTSCGCWGGPASYGLGPWSWASSAWGAGLGGWMWWNEAGDRLGCSPMSRVKLAGYPVRRIVSVTIDGVDVPALDGNGNPNWRLDQRRYLTRLDDPSTATTTPRFWPGCQNMSLAPDEPGTFEVVYEWGQDVPLIGKQAAIELANQLFLACGGGACVLPAGVTRVVRQGIEIERGLLANWMDPKKPTGLINLDTFLQAYWNGNRGGRVGSVWSPDVQQFARVMG